jgi:hypothetical protein
MLHTADLMLLGNHSGGVLVLHVQPLLVHFLALVDILPLNMAEAVRYLPCLGSEAHIMFLSCFCHRKFAGSTMVRSARALYCWEPLEVSGGESSQEEVQSWGFNQVHGQLSEVKIQLICLGISSNRPLLKGRRRPSGSDHCRLGWSAWKFCSRYHSELRYQFTLLHLCFRPIGVLKGWLAL